MLKFLLKGLLPLLILTIAGYISYQWMHNKPEAKRAPPEVVNPLVQLITPQFSQHQISVYAMGTVIAAQEVNLTSRISGMVIKTNPNFIEGGTLKKGEWMVQLDPVDYKLLIDQRLSELEKNRLNLKLEQGKQAIAKYEAQLLNTELTQAERALVFREPHLKSAKASLTASKASLKQAQLDLERTRPVSPFDAIVISRNANVGSWISTFSTGTPLAKLVGIKHFWIDVSLPVKQLRWIAIPGINGKKGSKVKLRYDVGWKEGVYRQGVIKRLKAEIEKEGRMAKLIVEIKDPLSQQKANKNLPPLMLGTLLRLKISGKKLRKVVELSENLLHGGNHLWLMSQDKKLILQAVKPVWKEQGMIYISQNSLPANAQIITSDLSTPVEGMSLQPETQPQ
ncbi:MAG: HlyD family efflux transporter periplasmic adaptor subunit [Methylococcales bacterium]|nr:HlyD family efflux transporter periplasmic adaptor subunit [Methylococcales bacterium]